MNNLSEDIKELVIFRLEAFPSNRKVSIGSYGEFTKEELIEHVRKGDEIGKKVADIEMEFIRALKEGIVS